MWPFGRGRALVLLAILLAGCAVEKVKEPPPMARQIVDRGRQGQAAYAKGDLARAAALFEQARRDAMRIEDSEGVAVMSINLARVLRESGRMSEALGILEGISSWHRRNISVKSLREIELLSAVLLGDFGQRDTALQRLQALRTDCTASCELAINLEALQARLLLEQGSVADAMTVATAAIARFQAMADSIELANLYRVQGEAQVLQGMAQAAKQSLEAALRIDKTLGQPAKIAQSLELLLRAAQAGGDSQAQAAYRARLTEVQQAMLKDAAKRN
jgi:tetratricopeptide (TPR) repeat protein